MMITAGIVISSILLVIIMVIIHSYSHLLS